MGRDGQLLTQATNDERLLSGKEFERVTDRSWSETDVHASVGPATSRHRQTRSQASDRALQRRDFASQQSTEIRVGIFALPVFGGDP